ncbi:MAG TPA: hypothetical protein VFO19_03205 [Vicinamibacterales bacterium]|nr:hypothetical protein [Vicinamibacterales bacterium]
MASLSVVVGVALIALGLGGYVMTSMVSITALIPAIFGAVIAALGAWGRNPAARKIAMHAAMGIALVGILGSIRGLFALPGLLGGGTVARPAAVYSQAAMAIILIVYLALGVRSFIAARRG